jgi:uncharacterized protein with GYD domain
MPAYIMLMKWTDQGVKEIKEVTQGLPGIVKAFETMGGKLIGLYAVMGEYDIIGIGEAPNDEAIMNLALRIGAGGHARTTTLKAFPIEQLTSVVKKLP